MKVQYRRVDGGYRCDDFNVEEHSLLGLRYVIAFRAPKTGRTFQEVYDDIEFVEVLTSA